MATTTKYISRLAGEFELASLAQAKKKKQLSYGKIDPSIQKMLNVVLLGMEHGGSIPPLKPNLIPLAVNGIFNRATNEALNIYMGACGIEESGQDVDFESVVFPRLKQDFAKYSTKKSTDWKERSGSTDKTNHPTYNWNDVALSKIVSALHGICKDSKIKRKAEAAGITRLIERVNQRDDWEENDLQDLLKTIEFLKSAASNSKSDESKKQQFIQKLDLWAAKAKESWTAMFPNFDNRNSAP